jgi:hypothetical protein
MTAHRSATWSSILLSVGVDADMMAKTGWEKASAVSMMGGSGYQMIWLGN